MNFKKWGPHLLIILAIALAYANCLQNEFVWDDEFLIEKNTYLRSFSHLPKMLISNSTAGFGGVDNFYRPTQNIYYLFVFQMFGYDKVAFHLANILIHIINALLIFSVFQFLLKSRSWAFTTSLLWALHPTHVEAVGYISGTADPLGLMFFLLCLRFMPWKDFAKNWKKGLLAWLCFILSLLSKEAMIVTPPLLMLILAYLEPEQRWNWRRYTLTFPFWISAGFYMFLRKTVLNFNETYDFYKTANLYTENMIFRVYTYLATLPEYLKILLDPVDLHMERKFPVFTTLTSTPVLLGLALVFACCGLVTFASLKRKKEWPLFCFLWFFISFVPMMGILVPVNSFILEHWLYLPSIGFFVVLARVLHVKKKEMLFLSNRMKKLLNIAFVGSAVVGSIWATYDRNKDWRDPITFYSDILKYSEGSARVHNNIAMAYGDKNELNKAIEHYLKAIELADAYPQTHYNLARAYIQLQDYPKALLHLKRSLEINPNFSYSKNLLNDLNAYLNRPQ